VIGAGQAPERLTCSRAGCLERATSRIEWRNPKIHAEDRVKVWLACDEHVEYLREFLAARQFPLRVVAAHAPSGGAPIEAATQEQAPGDAAPLGVAPSDSDAAPLGVAPSDSDAAPLGVAPSDSDAALLGVAPSEGARS
jgi:hypothetical protein